MENKTKEQLQKDYDELKLEYDTLKSDNEKLSAENEALDNLNKELQSEIEKTKVAPPAKAASTSLISSETFERNGKTYGFAYPGINHKGEVITADHVLASEQLQDELIKINSGMLVEK